MNTQEIVKKRIIGKPFKVGNPGGPGRPKETKEQKLVKRAVKELVSEYEENLAQTLPDLAPVVIKKALKGDIQFVKELHDVIGVRKGNQNITAVQVNIGEVREKYK